MVLQLKRVTSRHSTTWSKSLLALTRMPPRWTVRKWLTNQFHHPFTNPKFDRPHNIGRLGNPKWQFLWAPKSPVGDIAEVRDCDMSALHKANVGSQVRPPPHLYIKSHGRG